MSDQNEVPGFDANRDLNLQDLRSDEFDVFGLKPKFRTPKGPIPGAENVVIAPPPSESDIEQALRLNGLESDRLLYGGTYTNGAATPAPALTIKDLQETYAKASDLTKAHREAMNNALGRPDGHWTVIDADGNAFHGTPYQLIIKMASQASTFPIPFPNGEALREPPNSESEGDHA